MRTDLLESYQRGLVRVCKKLPEGALRPVPVGEWAPENVRLYQDYMVWLIEGGGGEHSCWNNYLPIAGYILGLNPGSFVRWDLVRDFEKVLEFVRARGASPFRERMARLAMERFRRFVRLELGLGELPKFVFFEGEKYSQGLPEWLAKELTAYQRSLQRNWRPERVRANLFGFWSKHARVWRFFCDECGVRELRDLQRKHVLAFIDSLLEAGYAVNTINCYILYLRGFLRYLQQEEYVVPQSLLRVQTLKAPKSLPKYLSDEQVFTLRDAISGNLREAENFKGQRIALMDQALFYLLWQGGLRVGEVEVLALDDLDLSGKRLVVKQGKGRKDRTVFLTPVAVAAIRAYLDVRGESGTQHVFLFRNAPLNKSYIWSRLKTLSKQTGIRVYAHRLRHTTATQLLNAGCRITSIQKILGHESINTTMIYARAYNQTVADDFYAAMQRVEKRLELVPVEEENMGDVNVQVLLDRLAQPLLGVDERLSIVGRLREVVGMFQ